MKVEPVSSAPVKKPEVFERKEDSKITFSFGRPLTREHLSSLATWTFRGFAILIAVYLLTQPGQKWVGAFVFGCGFAAVGMGVFLTFRILNFPDLTIEGSYALGATVTAALITGQKDSFLGNPWVATLVATICGALAGSVTGVLHTRLKINGLLASILVATALYSINIRILGKQAFIALVDQPTVVDSAINFGKSFLGIDKFDGATKEWLRLGFFTLIALLLVIALNWFLNTQLGLALRATGDNEAMIKALGFNTNNGKILVLALSNGLFGLTGSLVVAQYLNSVSSDAGLGLIVVGLAAVIVGESFLPPRSVLFAVLGAWVGSIIYRVIYTSVYGLDLTWDIFARAFLTLVFAALASFLVYFSLKSRLQAWLSLLLAFGGAVITTLLALLVHFWLENGLNLNLEGSIFKVEAGDIKLALAVLIIFAMGVPALRSRIGEKVLKAGMGKDHD